MGVVLDLLKPEIDLKLKQLDEMKFATDPVAAPYFSRITSVMSSAYKRHGNILERAILETLKLCDHFEVWCEPKFQVPASVDNMVIPYLKFPSKLIGAEHPYSQGDRTLQLDAIVFNKNTGVLGAYEVKRGFGPHDSGKRDQMVRNALRVQVLLKSYAKERGFEPNTALSHIIFFYGKCSIPKPFAITGPELDQHFGWPVYESVDEVNKYFQSQLLLTVAGIR